MNKQQIIDYYSREDIIQQLLKNAKDREVAGAFFDGSYDQRPNILQYPDDVVQMAKKGITSFHFSVERWKRPMQLTAENYEHLRKGFDVVIDIDSKLSLDESKITAGMICRLLEKYGIRNYSIKFSGRRGFHICMPWEMFPGEINYKPLASMYPDIPRIIAGFIRKEIEEELMKELVKRKSAKELMSILEEPPDKLSPFYFVEVEKDWGNRHMFRAPYSISYDEPIIVKKNSKIEVVKIGEFIDKFFNNEKNFQTAKISDFGHETISADLVSCKTKFGIIDEVIRHKINENMFLIKLETGRKVKITSGHSLFILKDGRIKTIKGNEISKGDYIVVPKRLPYPKILKKNDKIFLADELIAIIQEKEKRNTFLLEFDDSIFDKIYMNKHLIERSENIYNWKRYGVLPLDAYEMLRKHKILMRSDFENSKIKFCLHGGKAQPIPNKLVIDPELMRLLGYYVSEGCYELRRGRISFSFGSHEKKLIKDCINILKGKFKIRLTVYKPHAFATQIQAYSSTLKLIFSNIFKSGGYAKEKRIPPIVWIVDNDLKKEFLRGYLAGDGYQDKLWSRNISASASKELCNDMSFLLSMLGMNYLIYEKDNTSFSGIKSHLFYFMISGKDEIKNLELSTPVKRKKESMINLLPIKELGLENLILKSRLRNEYMKGNVIRRSREWLEKIVKKQKVSKQLLNIIRGDIAFLKVIDIKKMKSRYKYVYDLSIKNYENFISGTGILLHNSFNEKTWLVSLPISKNQLDKFTPEMAEPSKVVVKETFFSTEAEENEALSLLTAAMDWHTSITKKEIKKKPLPRVNYEKKIPEELFPPCIKLMLSGLADGRKRSIFTLASFLKMMNWPSPEIESRVIEWNEKNKQILPSSTIISQLRWNQQNQRNPANCSNEQFYKSIGICKPDEICKAGTNNITIKNPINYPFRKMKRSEKKSFTKRKYEPYKCSICNKGFKSMKSLGIHKTRSHGITS